MRGRQARRARRDLSHAIDRRCAAVQPNLVSARRVRNDAGDTALLLGRCPEPCLAELLLAGPLTPQRSVELVSGLALAVEALADAGLTARELTPDTVHLDPERGGVLCDAAIPFELFERPTVQDDEHVAYRSPEQLEGDPVDVRSNIYSLGVLLFTALVGAPPFGGTWANVYVAHRDTARPRASERRPGLAPTIDSVIGRAMAVDPADRFDRPTQLAEAAAAVLDVALTIETADASEADPGPAEPRRAEPKRAEPKRAEPQRAEPKPAEQTAAEPKRTPRPRRKSRPRGPLEEPLVAIGSAATAPAPTAPTPAATPRAPARSRKAVAPAPSRPVRKPSKRAHAPRPAAPAAPASPAAAPIGDAKRSPAPSLLATLKRPSRRPASTGGKTNGRTPFLSAPAATAAVAAPGTPNGSGAAVAQPAVAARRGARQSVRSKLHAGADRRRTLVLLGVAGVAVVVGGTALAASISEDDSSARATGDGLSVRLPAGWEQQNLREAGFLRVDHAIAAAPADGRKAGLVAGLVADSAAARRTIEELSGSATPQRSRTHLGRFPAWRYGGVEPTRGVAGNAYVAGTTAGPLMILCHAPSGQGSSPLAECANAASTVELSGARPLSPVVAEESARSLRAGLRTLRTEYLEGRRVLARASVASEQIAAAESLEASVRNAANRIRVIEPPVGAPDLLPLVTALGSLADGYRDLGSAISESDQGAYDAARTAIVEREAALPDETATALGQ